MNQATPKLTQRVEQETVSDAVWKYMTALKTIRKRDGREEPFDAKKLYSSVNKAFARAGFTDTDVIDRVVTQIISRLQRIYDGHTVASTGDIREVVSMTLIDTNFMHVSIRYMQHRQTLIPARSKMPLYGHGLRFDRFFTLEGLHPYDDITWEMRTAEIKDANGESIFEQRDIETPAFWSQTATNIVAQKYFRGRVGMPERESSMKQLVSRVTTTIANWGRHDGYFYSAKDAQVFEEELTSILIHQRAAFNSPAWFNIGVNPQPQCSACFINAVDDDMRSIMQLATTESMLFKQGSGTGTNLSSLRSSREFLSRSNGKSSGPVSFMKGFDAFAGVVKSGGKTRRAAKMVILNIDHPDIEEFIECKVKEEKKAWALIEAGYDSAMDGDAYSSIFFQNANNSVRVSDAFMQAVEQEGDWVTKEVTTGADSVSYKAQELFSKMAQATWECGDPGIQYDTTVNAWHTCKNSGRINGSNPCSEYMFLDDSACNLASLNLMKFHKEEQGKTVFDFEAYKKVAEVVITAMEIVVGNSSYPTPAIEHNSHRFRPLGIGFANLGALLMSRGLAYDSDKGRNLAASLMSLLSGHCYYQSGKISQNVGAFGAFEENKESVLEVMQMHRSAAYDIQPEGVPENLLFESRKAWDLVLEQATKFGLRNAQISVLAPTGTIAFLMDCDTTGVEPDIALVKYKWLVGGGMLKMVNRTVPEALTCLGYSQQEREAIHAYIEEHDTIEGAPHLKDEHLPVFDCAFKAKNGTRTIHYTGHLRMMAAVQPFISGAISKTVNMPTEATVEDVKDVYMQGWKMGLKAIAIYRDGSKKQQALTTSNDKEKVKEKVEPVEQTKKSSVSSVSTALTPRRRRMPDERKSITHRFSIANYKGYITVGLYDDGKPGELFVTMSKQGSVMSGLMDAFATSVSMALQYGVPLQVLVNKFVHMRFEPSGFTSNPNIRMAKSIIDYIFRWMALKFLSSDEQRQVGINITQEVVKEEVEDEPSLELEISEDEACESENKEQTQLFEKQIQDVAQEVSVQDTVQALGMTFDNMSDAPACDTCGSVMVRNGACYKCLNCGSTSGCS